MNNSIAKWHLKVVFFLSLILTLPQALAFAANPQRCGSTSYFDPNLSYGVICKNGSPNLNAYAALKNKSPQVMALTKYSSKQEIRKAYCSEIMKTYGYNATSAAYEYQRHRFDWPGDDLNVMITDREKQCAPYLKSSGPVFKGKYVTFVPVNPASGIAYFVVENNGSKSGKAKCKVLVSDISGTYKGYDYISTDEAISPGQSVNYEITLVITNQGAAYVSSGNVSCS